MIERKALREFAHIKPDICTWQQSKGVLKSQLTSRPGGFGGVLRRGKRATWGVQGWLSKVGALVVVT